MKKIFTTLALAAAFCGTANAETASGEYTLYLYDYNFVTAADQFANTVISANEEGVYTIENIFESGVNFSFILPLEAEIEEDASYATCVAEPTGDNVSYISGTYFRLLDEDGKPAGATFYEIEGNGESGAGYYFEEVYMDRLTFNKNRMKGYYYGDMTSDDGQEWSWLLSLAFYGLNQELFTEFDPNYYSSDWIYINAWIPNLAKMASEGSVNGMATENSAPVYYNLQGVRVANPENGLFIKRQGNKATKVIL